MAWRCSGSNNDELVDNLKRKWRLQLFFEICFCSFLAFRFVRTLCNVCGVQDKSTSPERFPDLRLCCWTVPLNSTVDGLARIVVVDKSIVMGLIVPNIRCCSMLKPWHRRYYNIRHIFRGVDCLQSRSFILLFFCGDSLASLLSIVCSSIWLSFPVKSGVEFSVPSNIFYMRCSSSHRLWSHLKYPYWAWISKRGPQALCSSSRLSSVFSLA